MAEEYAQHNAECQSEQHDRHLCYFISQGFHLSDELQYREMVRNPQFKCRHCGRVAGSDDNLCRPVKL